MALTCTLRPWASYLHTGTLWHSYQCIKTSGILPEHWDPVALLPAHWDPRTLTCTHDTLTCTFRLWDPYLHPGNPWHSYLNIETQDPRTLTWSLGSHIPVYRPSCTLWHGKMHSLWFNSGLVKYGVTLLRYLWPFHLSIPIRLLVCMYTSGL